MTPTASPPTDWLRQALHWSNSRQSWLERSGALVLLAGAGLIAWFHDRLSAAQTTALIALFLLALTALLRRGWGKLLGPVFVWDLVLSSRRRLPFFFRGVYATILFGAVFCIYASWFVEQSNSVWEFLTSERIRAADMADFAGTFFWTFVGLQFLLVLLLAPSYIAGTIAEEKEKRTIDFLLVTDLRNREIVLGNLASRLAVIALLVLTGLPVLSLMQFLGGVDPGLLLASFAFTGLTLFSLGSLAILCSVYARKARDAVGRTYQVMFLYLFLSAQLQGLMMARWGLDSWPSTENWTSPVTLGDVSWFLNTGNILTGMLRLTMTLGGGARLDEVLPEILGQYALFHIVAGLIFCTWAVHRLRAVAQRQAGPPAAPAKAQVATAAAAAAGRPPMTDRPILWKELHVETVTRKRRFDWLVGRIAFVAGFAPLVIIIAVHLYSGNTRDLGDSVNVWLRSCCTVVACGLLLHVGTRASRSIGSERDRQTFDALLLTALDRKEILWDKYLGSLLSIRWVFVWLACNWGVGLLVGGLHLVALPLLVVAVGTYAAFMAGLGLYFSVISRTTRQAGSRTILAAFVVAAGHWLIWTFGQAFHGQGPLDWLARFQAVGLTPPITLGFLALSGREFTWGPHTREGVNLIGFALLGLTLYGIGAVALWCAALAAFLRRTEPKVEPAVAGVEPPVAVSTP